MVLTLSGAATGFQLLTPAVAQAQVENGMPCGGMEFVNGQFMAEKPCLNNHQAPGAPAFVGPNIPDCMRRQNAMQPCTPDTRPVGVDPRTVGVWELKVNGARWIWRIRKNGTYEFHIESAAGAVSNLDVGSFAAQNGKWLKMSARGSDGGTYAFRGAGEFDAKGILGLGAWRRIKGASE